MKIDRVTITGADDVTNISDLVEITNKFPFVEWGILFSINKEGQNRYPKKEWINKITKAGIPLSAHLCGGYTREIFDHYDTTFIKKLKGNWKRVQLNYNFKYVKDFSWCANILTILEENDDKNYIFQYNKSNSAFIDECINIGVKSNFNILFDSSGGRGSKIGILHGAFKDIYTGYSGGIDPDNVKEVVTKLQGHPCRDKVWIDMESGVRTNDVLDLGKVTKVLEICQQLKS